MQMISEAADMREIVLPCLSVPEHLDSVLIDLSLSSKICQSYLPWLLYTITEDNLKTICANFIRCLQLDKSTTRDQEMIYLHLSTCIHFYVYEGERLPCIHSQCKHMRTRTKYHALLRVSEGKPVLVGEHYRGWRGASIFLPHIPPPESWKLPLS